MLHINKTLQSFTEKKMASSMNILTEEIENFLTYENFEFTTKEIKLK